MSIQLSPLRVACLVVLPLALSACAAGRNSATLPQIIQLSDNDRVSAETRRQIDLANLQIARYQSQRAIPLPVP